MRKSVLAGFFASQGAAYEAESLALFASWPNGQNDAVKSLINEKIVLWKDYGIWQKFDCLWFPILENEADGTKNWIKNDHHLTNINSTTWTSKIGYKGNGSTMCVKTDFTDGDGVNFLPGSLGCMMGMFIYSQTTFGSKALMGSNTSIYNMIYNTLAGQLLYYPHSTSNVYHNLSASTTLPIIKAGGRVSTTEARATKINSDYAGEKTGAITYNGALSEYYLLASNNYGTPTLFCDAGFSAAFFGAYLNVVELTYLYNQIIDFKTKLASLF